MGPLCIHTSIRTIVDYHNPLPQQGLKNLGTFMNLGEPKGMDVFFPNWSIAKFYLRHNWFSLKCFISITLGNGRVVLLYLYQGNFRLLQPLPQTMA